MTGRRGAQNQAAARVRSETMESMFGYAYTALSVNVALVLTNLPLALMLFTVPRLAQSWPFVLLLSLTLAPSLAAAFGTFAAGPDAGMPVLAFWRSYRRFALRAFLLGLAATVVVAAVLFDLALIGSNPVAPLLVPTLAVFAFGAIAVAVTSLAGFVLYGESATAWAIVKASIYLAVRRWYFSIMALGLLTLIAAAVVLQPVLGAFLAPAILLFAVWSNAHYSFARLLAS